MKVEEKIKARKLRCQGYSIKEIAAKLNVAKSSVSIWVRDIKLTYTQKRRLSKKGQSVEVVEQRRATRLARETARRQIIIDKAQKEIKKVSKQELFIMGVGLYWAEGSKTNRSTVEFYNSDPRLIKIMKRFFVEVCGVPEYKFRGHIYLHPHLDSTRAEKYWSGISGIPRSQFFKTTQQQNRASKNKKDSLPYGTFSLGVYDTKLFLRINGWMEGVYVAIAEK
jgi:transposase